MDQSIHDDYRIEYLKKHIEQMKLAVEEDGVDLIGYTPWGCIEWGSAVAADFHDDLVGHFCFDLFETLWYSKGTKVANSTEWHPKLIII